jgi:hypothetical protein
MTCLDSWFLYAGEPVGREATDYAELYADIPCQEGSGSLSFEYVFINKMCAIVFFLFQRVDIINSSKNGSVYYTNWCQCAIKLSGIENVVLLTIHNNVL